MFDPIVSEAPGKSMPPRAVTGLDVLGLLLARRLPHTTPRILRRKLRLCYWLAAVVVMPPGLLYLATGLYDAFGDAVSPGVLRLNARFVAYVCPALLVLVGIGSVWFIKRFARTVDRHTGEMCVQCGYILHGLPDRSNCPECGTPYSIRQLRATWAKAFKPISGRLHNK